MSLPASQMTLDVALGRVVSIAVDIKSKVQGLRDSSATTSIARSRFVLLLQEISFAIGRWDQAAAVPGLAAFAREQFDDPALDIVAEFNAMRAAAVTLQTWIFNNLPTDAGSGAILLETMDGSGTRGPLLVTVAQSAGFRTEADAFVVTIS